MKFNPLQNQITPPIILVQTWCKLLKVEDERTAIHARKMLLNTFGNMKVVNEFLKRNNIKV